MGTLCQVEPPAQEQTAAGGNGSPGLELFKQGLTLQGKWSGRLQHLAGGWTVHSRQKRGYLGQCPAHPCQWGPSLTGLWSEPGGAELTTPTEVKAATELMMVGMMLNLPACMNKDRGEWAGGLAGGPAGRE